MLGLLAPAASESAAPQLSAALANRAWQWDAHPFPHVVATDVFTEDVYAPMASGFHKLLDDPQSGFRRDVPGFDAWNFTFARTVPAPFELFASRAWHDLLCGLFGVAGTGQVSGGLHHHAPGSEPGGVHNDLNPGWFPAGAGSGEVVMADRNRCDYGTGRAEGQGAAPVAAVRAVAMIFYLANPSWSPGDGGATGLFRHAGDDLRHPSKIIPPHSNSLIAFECTPFSYHAFLGNCRKDRNVVVLWTHRETAEVEARWGKGAVVPWT